MRIVLTLIIPGIVASAVAVSGLTAAAVTPTTQEAFDAFWAADSPEAAARRVDTLLKSGVSFDQAYRVLRQGRAYGAQKTGMIRMLNKSAGGLEHHYALNIPASYDPARRYQVRFHLHGGIGGRQTNVPPQNAGGVGALEGAEQIYIVPFAWNQSPWWSDDQIENLLAILDRAKRLYNIDENRVVVAGVSDGGTGAYFVAMHETTAFAGFLPLNGFWPVLTNGDIQSDGPMYPNNLRNKPLFVVNGGRDPLYPTSRVDPYIDHFKKGGVIVDYRPQREAAHNTRWWPEVKDAFETFVRDHFRNPFPDTLTWETSTILSHRRAHWLVIDRVGRVRGETASLPDLNEMIEPPAPDLGVRSTGTRINRVMAGSNAERIGLKPGDVLVRVNDEPVRVYADISEAFADIAPGTPIRILVARNNAPIPLEGKYEPAMTTPPVRQVFDRSLPSGRVDLVRDKNTITATTRGVQAFTLLLSPDQFDFNKPVKVVANGRTVFDGRVQKDLRTLLTWAARDNDRTMLFGAELHLDLGRPTDGGPSKLGPY